MSIGMMEVLSVGCLNDLDCAVPPRPETPFTVLNFQTCRSLSSGGLPLPRPHLNGCLCSNYVVGLDRSGGLMPSNSCSLVDAGTYFFAVWNGIQVVSLLVVFLHCAHGLLRSFAFWRSRCVCLGFSSDDFIPYHGGQRPVGSGVSSDSIQAPPPNSKRRFTKRDGQICLALLCVSLLSVFVNLLLGIPDYLYPWPPTQLGSRELQAMNGLQLRPLTIIRDIFYSLFMVTVLACLLHLTIAWINTSIMIREMDSMSAATPQHGYLLRLYKPTLYFLEFSLLMASVFLLIFQYFGEVLYLVSGFTFFVILSSTIGSYYIVNSLRALVQIAESGKSNTNKSLAMSAGLFREKANEIEWVNLQIKRYGLLSICLFYFGVLSSILGWDISKSTISNAKAWITQSSIIFFTIGAHILGNYLCKMVAPLEGKRLGMKFQSQKAMQSNHFVLEVRPRQNSMKVVATPHDSPAPQPASGVGDTQPEVTQTGGDDDDDINFAGRTLFTIEEPFGDESNNDRTMTAFR